ncbi:hypothetical protein Moror_4203 [Moniliophthora roreri MCA 2997]|uniref:Uncharacterized protein n=1 Tax=Moniliophthora roreri (strain MCA 2997) TaxID=1381753 RepID=V2YG31_MONRO|nr:hypothetical protein Moror_4203 [Moniliophthora roreri MCA 2997]
MGTMEVVVYQERNLNEKYYNTKQTLEEKADCLAREIQTKSDNLEKRPNKDNEKLEEIKMEVKTLKEEWEELWTEREKERQFELNYKIPTSIADAADTRLAQLPILPLFFTRLRSMHPSRHLLSFSKLMVNMHVANLVLLNEYNDSHLTNYQRTLMMPALIPGRSVLREHEHFLREHLQDRSSIRFLIQNPALCQDIQIALPSHLMEGPEPDDGDGGMHACAQFGRPPSRTLHPTNQEVVDFLKARRAALERWPGFDREKFDKGEEDL